METEDLRRGNLVYLNNNIAKIDGIQPSWVWLEDNSSVFIEEIQPIPLTEEWLLKFGFEKNERYVHNMHPWVDYTKQGIRIQLPYFTFNFGDEDEQDIDIPYVHALQNLYFALKGKEL